MLCYFVTVGPWTKTHKNIAVGARVCEAQRVETVSLCVDRLVLVNGVYGIPVRSIMQSSGCFPEPLSFRVFRFAEQSSIDGSDSQSVTFRQPSPSQLTDTEHPWHVWGTGRMAW